MTQEEKSRIMLVEDNKIISMELKCRLEGMGYEVAAIVNTGEEAIATATEKNPDLVLMDIKLKGQMDGIEAANKIQSYLDIPVIYVTAYEDDATYQRAKATEPFGYLVKPVEEEDLHSTIESSIGKRRMRL